MLPTDPTAGDTSKPTPLHVTAVNWPISGVGFTYTTKVKLSYAVQFGTEGVTIYVVDCVILDVLRNLPNMKS
jgi:hypothetical protein